MPIELHCQQIPLAQAAQLANIAAGRYPPLTDPRSQAPPGNALRARLCLTSRFIFAFAIRRDAAPVTNYAYDNLGRVVSVENPDGHFTYYAYNAVNEVTSKTDALGNITGLTYDATGNVLTIPPRIPAAQAQAPSRPIRTATSASA